MILLLVRLLVRSSSIEFLRVEWPAVRDAPSLITTLTLPPLCLRGLYASNDREQNRSVDRAALRERAFLPFGFASGRVSDYIINRGWFLSLWQRIEDNSKGNFLEGSGLWKIEGFFFFFFFFYFLFLFVNSNSILRMKLRYSDWRIWWDVEKNLIFEKMIFSWSKSLSWRSMINWLDDLIISNRFSNNCFTIRCKVIYAMNEIY